MVGLPFPKWICLSGNQIISCLQVSSLLLLSKALRLFMGWKLASNILCCVQVPFQSSDLNSLPQDY